MRLYHTTTQSAWFGISSDGLLTSMSQGKEPLIWMHTASKIHWAIAHVQRRHGATLDEVVVLEVKAPRSGLRRAWKGLWKCSRNISPGRIRVVGTGHDLAASPIE